MKADALNPRELFGTTVHYEIPAFQRPYVWTLEDQWQPLWQDVRRVAEKVIGARGDEAALEAVGGHFLGAVVFKLKSATAGDVTRQSVIDGQQRSTTLQIMLDAVHEAILSRGHEVEAEAIEELILNQAKRFAGRPERFKLWPSRSDRAAFEFAMDNTGSHTGDHLIVEAHEYFRTEVDDWLAGVVEEGERAGRRREGPRCSPGRRRSVSALRSRDQPDRPRRRPGHLRDPQRPRHPAAQGRPHQELDLPGGREVHADVDSWPEKYWADFDDTWWRDEITQGRHLRSRIDIFLQYWLTMRRRDDVLTDEVFREFVAYAKPLMTTAGDAEGLLAELRRDAEHVPRLRPTLP